MGGPRLVSGSGGDPPPSGLQYLIHCWLRDPSSIEDSPQAPLLSRVAIIDSALQMGFTITLDDVTQEEFLALRMLQIERPKWEQEQIKREQAMEEARRRPVKGGF